jgi:hypothetical protein
LRTFHASALGYRLAHSSGTPYVSAWSVRRDARVVGRDNSSDQLATAARRAEPP